MSFESCFCSSLSKVMPVEAAPYAVESGCALRGERFSFQLAYRCEGETKMLRVRVNSPFGRALRVRQVGLVPVDFLGTGFDEDVISRRPGLFPDLLSDFEKGEGWVPLSPDWNALWFTVDIPEDFPAGEHQIEVVLGKFWAFANPPEEPVELCRRTFKLEVLPAVLPPQQLKNTHWFHSDCLASYYHVPVFSEEHWRIIGNFMRDAVRHGHNMILTPVVTPPLDTMPGGERPTVQLVGVRRDDGVYSFDFSLLERWIRLAEECGMRYFEMAHLFTQWGAKFTPKVMAQVDGMMQRIFGWDVPADSPAYRDFLNAFLPALGDYFRRRGMVDRVYFHCSDEPQNEHLESYRYAQSLLRAHLADFKFIDALSSVDFYHEGLVSIPVPCENHFSYFINEELPERWVYYCCCPMTTYCNRFIHMPSSRNWILGAILYAYTIRGFLHWGYNFYYTMLSRKLIDPYHCNSSGGFFPDGDAFVVYPGANGEPEDSIRYEVFYEALQLQRQLEFLESLTSRDEVMALLNEAAGGGGLTMENYPRGEERALKLRTEICRRLKDALLR